MQLIQLERDDWNFFCPSTGQPVFKDSGEPNASTVRGFWCHEVPDEPELLCEELKAQWAARARSRASTCHVARIPNNGNRAMAQLSVRSCRQRCTNCIEIPRLAGGNGASRRRIAATRQIRNCHTYSKRDT